MLYYLMFCLALFANPVFGEEPIAPSLPLNFYLPENYEMAFKREDGGFFLVPKGFDMETLEISKNSFPPLILGLNFQFSTSFTEEIPQVVASIKKQFPNGVEAQFSKWGKYHIVTMKIILGKDVGYMAYVGLDGLEQNGLMFNFVYSSEKEVGEGRKPRPEDLLFWENFIKKTEPIAHTAS